MTLDDVVGHQLAGVSGISGLHLDGGVLDLKAIAQLERKSRQHGIAGMTGGHHEMAGEGRLGRAQ